MLRNMKLDERVDCKVNLHEFKAIKYLINKPEDMLYICAYQIRASLGFMSLSIIELPNQILVPEEYEEDFERFLKNILNIHWYTEKQISLLSSKK